MIIVETAVSKLDREANVLGLINTSSIDKIYVMGALHAIDWIKNGGKSPSDIILESQRGSKE